MCSLPDVWSCLKRPLLAHLTTTMCTVLDVRLDDYHSRSENWTSPALHLKLNLYLRHICTMLAQARNEAWLCMNTCQPTKRVVP